MATLIAKASHTCNDIVNLLAFPISVAMCLKANHSRLFCIITSSMAHLLYYGVGCTYLYFRTPEVESGLTGEWSDQGRIRKTPTESKDKNE